MKRLGQVPWAALPLGAAVAVHLAFLLGPWAQRGALWSWTSDLIGVPASLLGALACFRAARAGAAAGAAWRAFGLGMLAFAAGDVCWTYLELVRNVQPFPSAADLLYLAMPVAFVSGFLKLPRPATSRLWGLALSLDLALVLGAAALFSWRFLFTAVFASYAAQPLALSVALAYPALDLALLALALLLAVQRGGLPRRPAALLALGMVSMVGADSAFAYLSAHDSYGSGAVTDLGWSLGSALVGAAALSARRAAHMVSLPAVPPPRPRWWPLAPYVAVVSSMGLQLSTLGEHGSAASGVLLGGGALTLLVVARLALSVRENAQLASALRASSGELEVRVAQRTEELSRQGFALDRANAELRSLSRDLEEKVTERTAALEASRAQLAYQAHHDALTGLPNRALFEDRLAQAVRHSARYGGQVAVLFIDLDGFKYVNDTFGHAAGDEVLLEIGRRLTDTVRAVDTVARLGGDEFVVLLTGAGQRADVQLVARRLLSRVTAPILAAGQELRITASLGVGLAPDDGDSPQALMMNADVAMYDAKRQGKNTVRFYEPGLNVAARRRAVIERRLRGALARQDFTLHYQPQHDGAGRVYGFEALLRWTDAELGAVSPAEFIPVAEDAGLVVPIGGWVLHEACRQNAQWQREGLWPVRMAVNVSPTQFVREDFVAGVLDTLERCGLEARWLELELTERLVVQDIALTAAKMAQLRAQGVRLALDDFGAGHSALSYLMRLPVSSIKIDRAFVHDLGRVEGASRVIGAIAALARALGLEVVAEGVETPGQLREVRASGCEFTQGYLLGRPGPAEAARSALRGLTQTPDSPVPEPAARYDWES